MGGVERVGEREANIDETRQFQRPARQPVMQRLALEQLHDELIWTHVIQGTDVGMIERRYASRFALKPLAEGGLGYLQRNRPVQPRVARLPDFPHAALTQRRDQCIRPELFAWGKRHRRLQ
jgi:hypothetical protein